MNDFTKYELKQLYEGLDDHWSTLAENSDLILKLEKMIDNYPKACDHEWLNMSYKYLQCRHCSERKGFDE